MIDLLILTSCIAPPKQDFLKLCDHEVRYNQTLECIKYFLNSKTFKRIVLCDGSGFEIKDQELENISITSNTELELLTFKQDFQKVKDLGKGYGEGQIMDYILENSRLFKSSSFFIKVTGRLVVENIKPLVDKLNSSNTYFNIYPSKYLGCVDTRVYAMPTSLYVGKFRACYKSVNDAQRHSYEFCFTDVINENRIKIHYFPEVPRISGISGTNNKPYRQDAVYYVECILTKLHLMNTKLAAFLIIIVRTVFNRF